MRCRVIYWNEEVMDREQRFLAMRGEDYSDPALYNVVAAVEIPDTRSLEAERYVVADRLFQKFNIGDHGGVEALRSMSAGDMVAFPDGQALVCQPVGWKSIYLAPDFSEHLKVLDDTRFLKRLQVKMQETWGCQT